MLQIQVLGMSGISVCTADNKKEDAQWDVKERGK